MKKRLITAILSVFILFGTIGTPLVAHADAPVQPFWTNTSNITLNMSYIGNGVTWAGEISGKSGTTAIDVTFTLTKKNASGTYTYANSWDYSTTNAHLTATDTYIGTKGSYKLEVSGTVTNSAGVDEYITKSLSKTFT